ncbi:MAG: pseudouridine synthase [Evtepia sp.]
MGRLDLDSEGLLLLTDDGALTNALLHPSQEVEKEYLVWVKGYRTGAEKGLERPMTLDGQALRPARVRLLAQTGERARLSVTIHEGKTARSAGCAPTADSP